MQGQTDGPGIYLGRLCRLRRLHREDVVAALQMLADELGEPAPRIDANHVGKWWAGVRNVGPYYLPRLCVGLEVSPNELRIERTPRLVRDINELTMRVMKRRQFLAKTSLVVGGLALGVAPSVDSSRLTPPSLRMGQDARVYEDLVRVAAGFADQLDMVSPTSLMPQVFGLLEQEKVLLAERAAPRLLEVTVRTAIMAGWLSYNVNNRGDAEAFWTFAVDRARELHSDQLMAYALGVRSNVFSAVPKRGGSPLDAALSIGQLEQAISLAKKGAPTRSSGVAVFATRRGICRGW